MPLNSTSRCLGKLISKFLHPWNNIQVLTQLKKPELQILPQNHPPTAKTHIISKFQRNLNKETEFASKTRAQNAGT